ncbi:MAG: DUF1080 domain-containing protein [Candidatus Poribacteria bacterium]|nr:DUF1080 domain-containing protein [Candidatus Poribacteria bacterium]
MARFVLAGVWVLCAMISVPLFAGTYFDDFEHGENHWRLYNVGDPNVDWVVEDGVLISSSEDLCNWQSIRQIGDGTWTNIVFECDFKITETFVAACGWRSMVGVGVRGDDVTKGTLLDFYWAAFNDFDWTLLVAERWVGWIGDLPVNPRRDFEPLEQDRWYHQRIVAEDNRIQLYLDDELMFDFETDQPMVGTVVLQARNATAHFDNIRITGDTVQDFGNPRDVSAGDKLVGTWGQLKSY